MPLSETVIFAVLPARTVTALVVPMIAVFLCALPWLAATDRSARSRSSIREAALHVTDAVTLPTVHPDLAHGAAGRGARADGGNRLRAGGADCVGGAGAADGADCTTASSVGEPEDAKAGSPE